MKYGSLINLSFTPLIKNFFTRFAKFLFFEDNLLLKHFVGSQHSIDNIREDRVTQRSSYIEWMNVPFNLVPAPSRNVRLSLCPVANFVKEFPFLTSPSFFFCIRTYLFPLFWYNNFQIILILNCRIKKLMYSEEKNGFKTCP